MLPSASVKAKLLKTLDLMKTDLDDSGTSLHVFPSKTNLKLRNISVTLKMVKKVVTNRDLSKHLLLILFQWWF